jgi:hypothetical protein
MTFMYGTKYDQELQKDITSQIVTDVFPRQLHKNEAFLHACLVSVLAIGESIKLEDGVLNMFARYLAAPKM